MKCNWCLEQNIYLDAKSQCCKCFYKEIKKLSPKRPKKRQQEIEDQLFARMRQDEKKEVQFSQWLAKRCGVKVE